MEMILLPVQNRNECLLENTCTPPHFCWDLVMRDVLVYLNENRVVTIFNHVQYICGVDS